jgi:type IV secretory pathway VirB2 component (pilin)
MVFRTAFLFFLLACMVLGNPGFAQTATPQYTVTPAQTQQIDALIKQRQNDAQTLNRNLTLEIVKLSRNSSDNASLIKAYQKYQDNLMAAMKQYYSPTYRNDLIQEQGLKNREEQLNGIANKTPEQTQELNTVKSKIQQLQGVVNPLIGNNRNSALTKVNPDDVFRAAIDTGESLIAPGQKILYGLAILAILGVGSMALFGNFPMGWAFGIVGGLVVMVLSSGFATWILDIAKSKKDSSDSFDAIGETMYGATMVIKDDVSQLLYILSGMAIVAIGTAGFFGVLSWKRVAALIAGLMVIAGATSIVSWVVELPGV